MDYLKIWIMCVVLALCVMVGILTCSWLLACYMEWQWVDITHKYSWKEVRVFLLLGVVVGSILATYEYFD